MVVLLLLVMLVVGGGRWRCCGATATAGEAGAESTLVPLSLTTGESGNDAGRFQDGEGVKVVADDDDGAAWKVEARCLEGLESGSWGGTVAGVDWVEAGEMGAGIVWALFWEGFCVESWVESWVESRVEF